MFKFKASYVALAAVLTSSVVYADPTSYTHSSGATVIDIEKPNAAGVSHNLYRDFNVGANGTILNNSGDDVSQSTFGDGARNNNLTAGSASVILNEVTSKNASSLKGFIEVNGQKADVVIANPNGITCSGCSFVNTNKAILTTGKVNMTDDGAIGRYTVTGGHPPLMLMRHRQLYRNGRHPHHRRKWHERRQRLCGSARRRDQYQR